MVEPRIQHHDGRTLGVLRALTTLLLWVNVLVFVVLASEEVSPRNNRPMEPLAPLGGCIAVVIAGVSIACAIAVLKLENWYPIPGVVGLVLPGGFGGYSVLHGQGEWYWIPSTVLLAGNIAALLMKVVVEFKSYRHS